MILAILATIAGAFFVYEIYLHFIKPRLSDKERSMITQDEQAIVDAVKGLLAKVASSASDIAAANQAAAEATARADAAEAALAAEKADHAELVSTLQSLTVNIPADLAAPQS